MRDQCFPQDFRCICTYFIEVFRNLDAARFSASAGMDLRFNYNYLCAKFFGCFYCFFNCKSDLLSNSSKNRLRFHFIK
ncbi:Uncharacterised protein [Mycobacteroides abscessus subsp. abscessus]|nr:Uncharacterised protein [Mycobacteroides abscessus subsp. abscessus]